MTGCPPVLQTLELPWANDFPERLRVCLNWNCLTSNSWYLFVWLTGCPQIGVVWTFISISSVDQLELYDTSSNYVPGIRFNNTRRVRRLSILISTTYTIRVLVSVRVPHTAKPKYPFAVQRYPGAGVRHHAASRVENPISVKRRYIGPKTSRSNPRAKRVKTQRGQTVAYDRQHTELVYDQANRLPWKPESWEQEFGAFRSTRTSGASNQGLLERMVITKGTWNTHDPKQTGQ